MKTSDLAREYGFTARYWTKLAAQGRIPGARQPFGPRGQWVFDPAVFTKWWNDRLQKVAAWPGYTVEAKSTGRVPSVTVETSAEASRLRTERLLKSVLYQPSDWVTLGGFPNRR
jgi:hypothetical protein